MCFILELAEKLFFREIHCFFSSHFFFLYLLFFFPFCLRFSPLQFAFISNIPLLFQTLLIYFFHSNVYFLICSLFFSKYNIFSYHFILYILVLHFTFFLLIIYLFLYSSFHPFIFFPPSFLCCFLPSAMYISIYPIYFFPYNKQFLRQMFKFKCAIFISLTINIPYLPR